MFLPLPSIEEQRAIVIQITTEKSRLDTLAVTTERSIALLKERLSVLIAAAAPGQIDGLHDAARLATVLDDEGEHLC